MHKENKIHSRKKFIAVSISAVALLSAFKFWVPRKKKRGRTVKMLTQDGELVEVDIAALPSEKQKITNKELRGWINKDRAHK